MHANVTGCFLLPQEEGAKGSARASRVDSGASPESSRSQCMSRALGGAPKAAREGACAPHPVECGSLLTKIEVVLLEHCQRLLVHRVAKPTSNLDALLLIDALNLLKPFRLAYPQAIDGTERLDQALR